MNYQEMHFITYSPVMQEFRLKQRGLKNNVFLNTATSYSAFISVVLLYFSSAVEVLELRNIGLGLSFQVLVLCPVTGVPGCPSPAALWWCEGSKRIHFASLFHSDSELSCSCCDVRITVVLSQRCARIKKKKRRHPVKLQIGILLALQTRCLVNSVSVKGCAVRQRSLIFLLRLLTSLLFRAFFFLHVPLLFLWKHVEGVLCTQLPEERVRKRASQSVREIRCSAVKFWVSSRAPSDLAFLKNRLKLLISDQDRGMHATHRDWSLSRPIQHNEGILCEAHKTMTF